MCHITTILFERSNINIGTPQLSKSEGVELCSRPLLRKFERQTFNVSNALKTKNNELKFVMFHVFRCLIKSPDLVFQLSMFVN